MIASALHTFCNAFISVIFSISMEKEYGVAWGYRMQVGARGSSPGVNRTASGKCLWHSPHAVHFSISIYLGSVTSVAIKLPASPVNSTSWVMGCKSRWSCLVVSDKCGDTVHKSQLLVGKVLSSWVINPPMEYDLSMSITFLRDSAKSSAARIPPTPPPITSTLLSFDLSFFDLSLRISL